MRIGWILGWAVPAVWFRPLAEAGLPGAEHVYFPATPGGMAGYRAAGSFDWTVGYSLGSLLLLEARIGGRVGLLSPILSFPSEEKLGGRFSRTQVRQLARWVRADLGAALKDFYRRAGLDIAGDPELPPVSDLEWGLDRLASARVDPPLPPGWLGWCGGSDPLLDAARLRELAPEIETVPGAGHHPAPLIRAFAQRALPREETGL
jgi:hypothetical protein